MDDEQQRSIDTWPDGISAELMNQQTAWLISHVFSTTCTSYSLRTSKPTDARRSRRFPVLGGERLPEPSATRSVCFRLPFRC